jgi:hypothetical protein
VKRTVPMESGLAETGSEAVLGDGFDIFLYNSIYTIIMTEKNKAVGHKIKIQRVERGRTKSYYVNFPVALAEAAQIQKGEELEWLMEDRNTFILRRVPPKKSALKRMKSLT